MGNIQMKVADLYEPGHTLAWPWLSQVTYPWEILPKIKEIILTIGASLDPEKYDHPEEGVWIAKSAKVFPSAYIGAPCIIGENTEVRHCAFIRGSALVGDGCVVGNSVELKNVIISDGVQVPHYNYVGDSVLGYKSHMGAGSLTSNVKSDKTLVVVKSAEGNIETGLKKFGAMLGDFVEVGCNSVLNPGTVIGSHSNVYPTSSVRGVIPSESIFKSGKVVEVVKKQQ
ncbi:MAG: UDP-N-acetylglucosamine pyrophosphorylase [Lachnospiraceae bacterium]|nr:UDP-N-acetylglucosamine pyrophosphorylase [Lachnospiraceae bacterium]